MASRARRDDMSGHRPWREIKAESHPRLSASLSDYVSKITKTLKECLCRRSDVKHTLVVWHAICEAEPRRLSSTSDSAVAQQLLGAMTQAQNQRVRNLSFMHFHACNQYGGHFHHRVPSLLGKMIMRQIINGLSFGIRADESSKLGLMSHQT